VEARAVAFALPHALLESEFAEAPVVDEFADDQYPPPGIDAVVAGSHRQLAVAVDAEDHDRENIARCAWVRAARGDVAATFDLARNGLLAINGTRQGPALAITHDVQPHFGARSGERRGQHGGRAIGR